MSLNRVPKYIDVYHGSPIVGLDIIKPHIAYSYSNYGEIVFGSHIIPFAACFGFGWRDDIARQKSINDEIHLIINKELAKKISNHGCSLYKLKNDGKWYYLPDHPRELIHYGSCLIIDEITYKSPLVMMHKCGVKLHIINGDVREYKI